MTDPYVENLNEIERYWHLFTNTRNKGEDAMDWESRQASKITGNRGSRERVHSFKLRKCSSEI